jgi:SAM-dependent methyltransferase
MSDAQTLEFTGERFTPECVREMWYEHWHRYVFARRLVVGKRVLDAACGEGYGSALLAETARQVTGLDIDAAAVAHATERYVARSNLRFAQHDATKLEFPPDSFDVIVSFETLEHVTAQEELVAGFARALSPDGVLIISSPDKKTYSDDRGYRNEFHVRELYRDELTNLLRPHFPHVRLYGQKLVFQSAIWNLETPAATIQASTAAGADKAIADGLAYEPLYFIAVCSRQPLSDDLADVALFGDREESVYSHYNGEVRRNMAAGHRIAELEADLKQLRAAAEPALAASPVAIPWWRRLLGERRR